MNDRATEGVFRWVEDNSEASFLPWATSSEPSDANQAASEDCSYMYEDAGFRDLPCGTHSNVKGYMCQIRRNTSMPRAVIPRPDVSLQSSLLHAAWMTGTPASPPSHASVMETVLDTPARSLQLGSGSDTAAGPQLAATASDGAAVEIAMAGRSEGADIPGAMLVVHMSRHGGGQVDVVATMTGAQLLIAVRQPGVIGQSRIKAVFAKDATMSILPGVAHIPGSRTYAVQVQIDVKSENLLAVVMVDALGRASTGL